MNDDAGQDCEGRYGRDRADEDGARGSTKGVGSAGVDWAAHGWSGVGAVVGLAVGETTVLVFCGTVAGLLIDL